MNKLKFFLIVAVILSAKLFASDYEVINKKNGFILKINQIDYKLNENQFKVDGFSGNSYSFEADSNFQILSFIFAYPNDFNIKVNQTFYDAKKYDGNYLKDSPNLINTFKSGNNRTIPTAFIQIFPYKFSAIQGTIQLLKSIEIDITFDSDVSAKPFSNLTKREFSFFDNYLNSNQIEFLRINNNIDISLQNNNKWYYPNKEYIKIETVNDGVACVKMSDVFKILPNWKGRNSNSLTIFDNGKMIPIYIKNDNGTLDDNDEVYFYGSRAYGDTTYYENYTNKKSYYLTFDDAGSAPRLNLLEKPTDQLKIINKIKTKYHIEKDSIYYEGDKFWSFQLMSETTRGEGWYWKIINPDIKIGDYYIRDDTFRNDIVITPSPDQDDELKVTFGYYGLEDTAMWKGTKPYPPAYYELDLSLNNNFLARDAFIGSKYGSMNGMIKSKNLFAGNNLVEVVTKQYDINTNAQAGIDYFEIEGNVSPFAYKSKLYLEDSFNESVKFNVTGFSEKDIVIIDTAKNRISFNTGIAGTTIRLGASGGVNPFATLGINDSIVSSKKIGMHILVMKDVSKNIYEYQYFENNFSNAITFINSLPINSIITLAFNSTANLTSDVKDLFISLGAEKIKSLNIGNVYIFSTQTNTKKVFEFISENDIVSIANFIENENGLSYQTEISLKADDYKLFLNSADFYNRTIIAPVNYSDLYKVENQADAIFITHNKFIDEAKRLAKFREESQNIKVEVVDIEDIYKEFDFGKKSPNAIKNFLKYALYNWQSPKMTDVLLIGDACWDARNITGKSISTDYVPTFGYPVTDFWYTLLDDSNDKLPDCSIGRLTVDTKDDITNIVDKLIEYDTTEVRPWMKDMLGIVGGYDEGEIGNFYWYTHDLFIGMFGAFPFCGNTTFIRKNIEGSTSNLQANDIINEINKGKFLTVYVGHASAEVFDLDGWEEEYFSNKGRYNILATVSCNTGAFAEPTFMYSRNERYLRAKDKGMIAALGSTTAGYVEAHLDLLYLMTKDLKDTLKEERSLGRLLSNAKISLPQLKLGHKLTNNHYNMLGDPLTRLRFATKPDFYLLSNNIKIENEDQGTSFSEENTTAKISSNIYNIGFGTDQRFYMYLVREFEGVTDTLKHFVRGLCYSDAFSFDLPISGKTGVHKCKLIIDPDNYVLEANKNNNIYSFEINVYKNGLIVLDPSANSNIDLKNKLFRFINPIEESYKFEYDFYIYERADTNSTKLIHSSTLNNNDKTISIFENYIDWNPNVELQEGKLYYLGHKLTNTDLNKESSIQFLPFYAIDLNIKDNLTIGKFSTEEQFKSFEMNNFTLQNTDNKPKIKISDNARKVFISGFCCGNATRYPHAKIMVGDSIITNNIYNKGFNLATVSAKEENNDFKYRYYSTYSKWGIWRVDSQALMMLEFMRDSIADDEYLLVTNNEFGFSLFIINYMAGTSQAKMGTLDSLIDAFEMFGGVLPKTIKPLVDQYIKTDDVEKDYDEFRTDYIFTYNLIGWKGAKPGTVYEKLTHNRDTLVLEAQIFRFRDSSNMITSEFGPAKSWSKLKLFGNLDFDQENSNLKIYGIDFNGNKEIVYDGIVQESIDLTDLKNIKYINAELSIKINDYRIAELDKYKNFEITGITAEYESLPELAVVKNDTKLSLNNELRGTDTEIFTSVQNISPRVSAPDTDLKINVKKGGTDDDIRMIKTGILLPNEKKTFSQLIKTDNLDNFNTIAIDADNSNISLEQYKFNNSTQKTLNVIKDTIKPTIELFIDGKKHIDGDYIQILPEIEVKLYDNSPLLITDSNSITVRLNGYMHPFQRTLSWNFESYKDNSNLKAKFAFKPDTIQYEDVSIIIYLKDAEGNRDTINYSARVTLRGAKIKDVLNYPNPFVEGTTLVLNYYAPANYGEAIVDIYDFSGYKHNTLNADLMLGKNEIYWDGKDNGGNSLPIGLYFMRITYKGDVYVEPQIHKVIKMN